MEWRGIPQPPMQAGAFTRSSKGGIPWRKDQLREGFQSGTTDIPQSYIPIERPAGASYATQLVVDMKNAVGEKINAFITNYTTREVRDKDGKVSTISVTYWAYYKPALRTVYLNIPASIDDVYGIQSTEPVNASATGASTEGMQKLKAMYAVYVGYLADLEKDRPLAELKMRAADTMARFDVYYTYITGSGTFTAPSTAPSTANSSSTGISAEILGMSVPSDDETNADKSTLFSAETTAPVEDVKTKYERLLYNDVVSVAGRGVPNDILARLKFQVDSAMKDFEEAYITEYEGTLVNTYFRDISGGQAVINLAANIRRDRTRMEGYTALQLVQTPFKAASEPEGYNRTVLDALLGLYKSYKEGVGKLEGLVASARAMAELEKTRKEVEAIIQLYNNIYSEVANIREFKSTANITISTSTGGLQTPVARVRDNLTDIQYVKDKTRTTVQLLDVKNAYTSSNGYFYNLYTFIRNRSFEIMRGAKELCENNPQTSVTYTQAMIDVCSVVSNLRSTLDDGGTVDTGIIKLIDTTNYTSYVTDTPTIIQKYIDAINAIVNAQKVAENAIKFGKGAIGNIQKRLNDAHLRFIKNRRLIDPDTLTQTNKDYLKYPIGNYNLTEEITEANTQRLFRPYLEAFSYLYDPVKKQIQKQINMFTTLYNQNKSLIEKAIPNYVKYSLSDLLGFNTEANSVFDTIEAMPFVLICKKKAEEITVSDISDVMAYKDYPEETPIEVAMKKLSDTYDNFRERYMVLLQSLALIPTERVYVLNDDKNLDGMKLTIPYDTIKYFDKLDYILVGGGARGANAGNNVRGAGGGGSGYFKASIPGSRLNILSGAELNPRFPDVSENRYALVPQYVGTSITDISGDIVVNIGSGGTQDYADGGSTRISINGVERAKADGGATPPKDQWGSGAKWGGPGGIEDDGAGNELGNGLCDDPGYNPVDSVICFKANNDPGNTYNGENWSWAGWNSYKINGDRVYDGGLGGFPKWSNKNAEINTYSNSGGGGGGGIGKGYSELGKITGRKRSGGDGSSTEQYSKDYPVTGSVGEDWTGAGGGGGDYWTDRWYRNGYNGGHGYAILYFSRQTSLPLSVFQSYIHIFDDKWEGPLVNIRPDNFTESTTPYDTFELAKNAGVSANRIVFSPKTLKYYRVDTSQNNIDVTSPYEIGYTTWNWRSTDNSLMRKQNGIVPKILGLGALTNSSNATNLIASLPKRPGWKDPVSGSAVIGDVETPFDERTNPSSGCTQGVTGTSVFMDQWIVNKIAGSTDSSSVAPDQSVSLTLTGDTLVVCMVLTINAGNPAWASIFDMGNTFPNGNFILVRSGNANYFSTVNVVGNATYIETDFQNIPFKEGEKCILVVKFAPQQTSMFYRKITGSSGGFCPTTSTDRQVQTITETNNIVKGRVLEKIYLSSFPYVPNNNSKITIHKFFYLNDLQENLPNAFVDKLVNYLFAQADESGSSSAGQIAVLPRPANEQPELFTNPPPQVTQPKQYSQQYPQRQQQSQTSFLPTPIYRSGATLDAAFTGSLLK